MPMLTSQDWEAAKPFYGKTLRVHQIDLNDPSTIPPIVNGYRATGAFRAHPALNVKLQGVSGRYLPLDGVLVIVLGPRKDGEK